MSEQQAALLDELPPPATEQEYPVLNISASNDWSSVRFAWSVPFEAGDGIEAGPCLMVDFVQHVEVPGIGLMRQFEPILIPEPWVTQLVNWLNATRERQNHE